MWNCNFEIKAIGFLLFVHCRYGSPSKPGGHVHVALWFSAEQIAVWLHGLSAWQGLIQLLLRHAWLEEHSLSDEHPIGSGSTKKTKEFLILWKFNKTIFDRYETK